MGGILILRVISGTAKGHKLRTPKGNATRPTTDRVKESLFNIIAPYIENAKVLDLFAGTGSLGIEALSRGADSAVFVDKSQECYGIIKDNLVHTKLSEKAEVFTGDSVLMLDKFLGRKFDIIFLDPPYSKGLIDEALINILKNELIHNDSVIVAERDAKDVIPNEMGIFKVGTLKLKKVRDQKYGDTILSFYTSTEDPVQ
jgi:16S rRNA (guanine(966)-N(2))-methyltransferase RsmD